MASNSLRLGALAAIAVAGMIAVGAGTAAAGKGGNPTPGALRCDIRQSLEGDTILVEPIVEAGRSLSGAYSLSLSGGGAGGSSNISQGGDFTARAGGTTTLGQMRVGASGAAYRVKLKVTANGESVSCSRQVTGTL